MSSFTVRPYEAGDEEGLLSLFNAVFSADAPDLPPRSLDVWRHIYLENPAGHQIIVAEDRDRNIIGQYAALPADQSVEGKRLPCAQAVDTCIDASWRGTRSGSSVFRQITRAFIDTYGNPENDDFDRYIYGVPNAAALKVGTRVAGYQPVYMPVPTLVKDFGEGWAEELQDRAGAVVTTESDWEEIGEMAALFERRLAEFPLGPWRDARYLAWRYRDWPDSPYRALLARRDDELAGALVFRLGWMGHAFVPVVDWIGSGWDVEAVASLLARLVRITLREGGRRIETWVNPESAHRQTLERLGMSAEPSPFATAVMIYAPDLDVGWVRDHWFITMGDFDIF